MAESTKLEQNLVHLARLALSGQRPEILRFVRQLAKRLAARSPETAQQLNALLHTAPTKKSPFRTAEAAAVPVDTDSRLQLVRFEYPVQLDVRPIWSSEIHERLHMFMTERQRETDLMQAGLDPANSLLFIGPPGVGKTLAARWLASELDMPLLILDLSAVMSSFLGRTGSNIRQVMDYAKEVDSVLLLDELDAIAKRRDDAAEIGELKRLVTVLVQEIDDWPPNRILIAATNHSDLLDPALWRRFDMILDFPMPSREYVEMAIRQFLDADPSSHEPVHNLLSILMTGMSFSDIRRELLRIRRGAVVSGQPVEHAVEGFLAKRISSLARNARLELALELVKSGYSQRQAHEWTGVSRDTIRRRTSGRNTPEAKPK